MSEPARILLVEDSRDDAELVVLAIERGGFRVEWERVETSDEMRKALATRSWDAVISDHSLPAFSAPAALAMLQQSGRDIPFIIVSGTIGEETAAALMKAGAHDFLLKTNLARLAPALARELSDAATRRKRRESEDALRLRTRALEASANAVLITDAAGTIVWVNPAFTWLTGYDEAEVLGRTPRVLKSGVHEDAFYAEMWQTVLAGRVWHGELVNRRKDGVLYTEDMTITPVTGENGAITNFIAVKEDVSERKHHEEALQQSEERFREFVEQALVGAYRTTPDGRIVMANPALVRMLGYDSFEQLARHNLEEASTKGLYPGRTSFRVLMDKEGLVTGFESTWTTKDEKTIHVRENARAVRDTTGAIVYYDGTVEDLTTRKLLEAQLAQAQKMEAVGRLAGGVAHDFNNLLQAILSALQALRAREPAELADKFDELEGLVRRGAQLTRQLLLFSRHEKLSPARMDLNEMIRSAERLLRRLLRANISITLDLAPRPLWIEADQGQLEQVLMNLAVNSSDAMPDGGRLTIKTECYNDHVALAVTDTGTGIPDEVRARLFEPFFTTKAAGRGTGLGLSVVHGIVAAHGGSIVVESELGLGTTFRITLPRIASGEFPRVSDAILGGELPKGRGERVLVVEDETGAREGLEEILKLLGYQVVAVGTGAEALAVPAEPPFALVVTDLMLPDTLGNELAVTLQERWPRIGIVLMSGYTDDEVVRRDVAGGVRRFLQKPFDMATLAREVRAALDER